MFAKIAQTMRRVRQIADLADTIIAVGKSEVLTAKTARAGETKANASAASAAGLRLHDRSGGPVARARDEPRGLAKYAKPDELEAARMILHDYIGEVSVVEDAAGVYGARQNEQRRGV